jgi:hypothetical protein
MTTFYNFYIICHPSKGQDSGMTSNIRHPGEGRDPGGDQMDCQRRVLGDSTHAGIR